MTDNEKNKPTHSLRCSYVYERHSKAAQVQYHREPADRQYQLAGRALGLGWSKSQIKIIDEGLAHLGSQTSDHLSFAMMTTKVALGHVSLILSTEVSSVARNPALRGTDDYRLLDLFSIAYIHTLIADEDGRYHLGFLNDRLFGPSDLAWVPLPKSFLPLTVKFFLRDSLDHPHLYLPPSGLLQSNLYRAYLALVLPEESRSLIHAAWTDLDMNNCQHFCSYDARSISATLGSLSHLLHARKVVDSLLRKIDASDEVPIPSKKERDRATPTHPLARSGKIAPATDPMGGTRPRHPKNDHRHTGPVDRQSGLSKNSGGQP